MGTHAFRFSPVQKRIYNRRGLKERLGIAIEANIQIDFVERAWVLVV